MKSPYGRATLSIFPNIKNITVEDKNDTIRFKIIFFCPESIESKKTYKAVG
jgi:hypothetical protein